MFCSIATPSNALCIFLMFSMHNHAAQASDSADSSPENILGVSLQSCSQSGMALTGYTRSGYCVDINGDTGSHHICIDLSSATGGNFCDVTGQNDWCSSEMTCHDTLYDDNDNEGNDEEDYCPLQNWCVCQWAFATYLQKAGGCDQIQDIVCESINMQAVLAYQSMSGKRKYNDALKCIESRCGVSFSRMNSFSLLVRRMKSKSMSLWATGVFIAGSVAAVLFWKQRQHQASLKEDLLEHPADGAEKPSTYQSA